LSLPTSTARTRCHDRDSGVPGVAASDVHDCPPSVVFTRSTTAAEPWPTRYAAYTTPGAEPESRRIAAPRLPPEGSVVVGVQLAPPSTLLYTPFGAGPTKPAYNVCASNLATITSLTPPVWNEVVLVQFWPPSIDR
jgi:hypothetical protein